MRWIVGVALLGFNDALQVTSDRRAVDNDKRLVVCRRRQYEFRGL